MLRVFAVALVVVFGVSCSPLSEDIVGRYSLDEGGSCNSCAEAGPRTMTFRQVEGPDGGFRYRFDFDDGGAHSGAYQFVASDSSDVRLTLYPDSSSPFHADILGEVILTQYTLRSGVIREPCGGLLKQCKWRP
ncbi:MAG TPA: hypothetical protein DHV07_02560 [Flavobacteriales bacterium]|jgi:hypothetical protein|nr:hypothetical protein [Flavobacteriales bacterium]